MAKTGTNPDDESEKRVLHIYYEQGDEEGFIEALRSIDAGEEPGPHFEVVYHDMDDLKRATREKNVELLQAIAREEPASIRETARIVNRDVSQVHTNLKELESLHLIKFESGRGGAKRPYVWYDELDVHLPLGGGSNTEGTVSA